MVKHDREHGINGDIDKVLYPIQHGVLFFCGFEVLPPFVAYGPARASDEERAKILAEFNARLRSLDAQPPLPFHPLAHYGEGMQLRPEFQA